MDRTDKLNRGEYIKFVENLIIKSEDYKRDDESSSYVIALDSPWGTGKSFFIDLLVQDIETSEKIRVVKYNAWKNDYSDDAFNPLIYDILNSDCLHLTVTNEADKEIARNIIKNIINVGIVFSKQWIKDAVKDKTGFDVDKIIEEAFKSGKGIKDYLFNEIPNLAEVNAQREAFEKFKSYLSNITEKMAKDGKKLVVVIDELDRCKPTFAIQTLEVVKHIFDIKNTVFLFAVDLRQLSYSISSVYGQGFDSVGYLRRFFDYIAKLPAPDINSYIEDKVNEIASIPDTMIENWEQQYGQYTMKDAITHFFIKVFSGMEFSLRDFDTVLQSYIIMSDNFLKNYDMVGAHFIYIFYLSLKYKYPELFQKIFIDAAEANYKGAIRNELESLVRNVCYENKWIIATVQVMWEDNALEVLELCPEYDERGDTTSHLKCRISIVHDKDIVVSYPSNDGWSRTTQNRTRNVKKSFGNIIFDRDLDKWEKIKNLSYRGYLHKQLEMYNFSVID